MLDGESVLPLRGRFTPVSSDRHSAGQTGARHAFIVRPAHRVAASIGRSEETGAFRERRVVQVEHATDLGVGRQLVTDDGVRLGDLGRTVLAEAVGFKAADACHELGARVTAVGSDLLPVVPMAAKLDVRSDRQRSRGVERRFEADHAAGRVTVEH